MTEETRQLPDSRPRFFYGYIILIAAFCIMLVYMGARTAFGVFFKPMADELRWSSAALSTAYALSIFLEGGVGIIMGRITDRLGPRAVIIFCGVLLGLGFYLISLAHSIWQMYLVYGLIIGTGMSGIFVPLVTNVARWFVVRRGMITGILLASTGIGTVISAPVANWLVSDYGWRESYIIFGVAVFIVFIIAAQFLKRDPSQVGQVPDGGYKSREQASRIDDTGFTLSEALSTRQFWFTAFMLFTFGFCGFALTVHIVPHVINLGMSPGTGAGILAISGGVGIIGRLTGGTIADRIGNRRTFVAGFIASIAIIFWLAFTREIWGLYLYAVVWGFCQGGVTSLYAPMVAELFGLKWHGLIFGACGFAAMVGGTLGPILTGYVFDLTGRYQIAFFALGAILTAGLIFAILLKPVSSEKAD